jgi:hypothetical protein
MHYEANIKYMNANRTGFGGDDFGAVQAVRKNFSGVSSHDLKMTVYRVTGNDKSVMFVGTVHEYMQSCD